MTVHRPHARDETVAWCVCGEWHGVAFWVQQGRAEAVDVLRGRASKIYPDEIVRAIFNGVLETFEEPFERCPACREPLVDAVRSELFGALICRDCLFDSGEAA